MLSRFRSRPALLGAHLLLSVLFSSAVPAAPVDMHGSWYRATQEWQYAGQSRLADAGLVKVPQLSATGGRFWYEADFKLAGAATYVLDFKNSSTVGRFQHFVYDAQGRLVAHLAGGIQSDVANPFFLRHGRELVLAAGDYRLISELDSPFFLAQPEPYLDTLSDYRSAIKAGNALVLVCLGVFLGLGFYYAALAMVRRRTAERMYAIFILGNLLYNGTALLVYPDLFGMHWFYMVSVPVLFSNCAYIVFVMALLELRPGNHPRLYRVGMLLLALFMIFIVLAGFFPNWSLELDRYGVGLFMTYGLVAGIVRARQGNASARLYLVAIAAFFVLGLTSISLSHMDAHTLYVEHIGLLAVAVEVFLLALVLSYQFALLNKERQTAVDDAKRSILIAHTDALTGLPNRFNLEIEIVQLPAEGSLTIIDLDGLKHYNDTYGHLRGDELLCSFSHHLKKRLGSRAILHRMGGDEFAITCRSGDTGYVEEMLAGTMEALRKDNFGIAGASFGSALVMEDPSKKTLKQMADERMYLQKQMHRRRASDHASDHA
ncbi:diguanylate cyclase [Undibacterium sp.]|jgi:diguanylate cyclase (GGDEF)-like protein|uniref:GGDEF domain-containing protein n=1 Tax=Undibacterium sp. TaxID=1914977 RepID=UPI002D7EA0FD|nr:diguanylate cyclase [Undibacterium sp.]